MNADPIGRSLPHDPQAEAGLIGCFLVDSDPTKATIDQAIEGGLSSASFHEDRNAKIFCAISALHDEGTYIDSGTVGERLNMDFSGASYLVELEKTAQTTAYFRTHLAAVLNCAARRDIIKNGTKAVETAFDPALPLPTLVSDSARPTSTAPSATNSCGHATDLDAACRFAETYHDRLRYVPALGWHYWDGRRWAPDTSGQALEYSKQAARAWTIRQTADEKSPAREVRIKSALGLESGTHIRAAAELAETDPRIVLPSSELDRDPWLLTVNNGTLDLRTGTLRKHSRRDFITKLAPVDYRPDAQHAALDRLLKAIADTCGPDMPPFLARCIGCTLTGDVSVETLFLLQGEGGAGKTTLIEAASGMLGDYAVKLAFDSFVLSKYGRSPGAATPDLVKLRGSRLAFASEGDVSARLDAGTVKTLTGGEQVTARPLYGAPITFPATWKLWLVSNFDPQCDADDSGLWRRLIKLRFESVPQERRDPRLKEALLHEPGARSALLAWSLKGCLDWQQRAGGRIGLAPPEIVERLTGDYRESQDTTSKWWDDLIAVDARTDRNGFTLCARIRQHYENWCDANGASPLGLKRFAEYLEKRGLAAKRTNSGRGWQGLHLF